MVTKRQQQPQSLSQLQQNSMNNSISIPCDGPIYNFLKYYYNMNNNNDNNNYTSTGTGTGTGTNANSSITVQKLLSILQDYRIHSKKMNNTNTTTTIRHTTKNDGSGIVQCDNTNNNCSSSNSSSSSSNRKIDNFNDNEHNHNSIQQVQVQIQVQIAVQQQPQQQHKLSYHQLLFNLVESMLISNTLKEQIQSLQTYRNNNNCYNNNTTSNNNNNNTSNTTSNNNNYNNINSNDTTNDTQLLLLQCLLELYLSYNIPTSLRRSIMSSIVLPVVPVVVDTYATGNNNNNIYNLQQILVSILHSIYQYDNNTNTISNQYHTYTNDVENTDIDQQQQQQQQEYGTISKPTTVQVATTTTTRQSTTTTTSASASTAVVALPRIIIDHYQGKKQTPHKQEQQQQQQQQQSCNYKYYYWYDPLYTIQEALNWTALEYYYRINYNNVLYNTIIHLLAIVPSQWLSLPVHTITTTNDTTTDSTTTNNMYDNSYSYKYIIQDEFLFNYIIQWSTIVNKIIVLLISYHTTGSSSKKVNDDNSIESIATSTSFVFGPPESPIQETEYGTIIINNSIEQISNVLENLLLLSSNNNDNDNNIVYQEQDYWILPSDVVSIIAIAYGRTIQYKLLVLLSSTFHNNDTSTTGSTDNDMLLYGEVQKILSKSILQRIDNDSNNNNNNNQKNNNSIPDLHYAAIIQGLASTLPNTILLLQYTAILNHHPTSTFTNTSSIPSTSTITIYEKLLLDCEQLMISSNDPDVRLHAIKGLQAITSRIYNTILLTNTNDNNNNSDDNKHVVSIATIIGTKALSLTMIVWENPSTRKLANAIPSLFQLIIQLLVQINTCTIGSIENTTNTGTTAAGKQLLQQQQQYQQQQIPVFNTLLEQILNQPPNRKGRYIALETLLPIAGAKSILNYNNNADVVQNTAIGSKCNDTNKIRVLYDLLNGVGDRGGYNTSVIADLWSKLIRQLLIEMVREEEEAVHPIDSRSSSSSSNSKNAVSNNQQEKEVVHHETECTSIATNANATKKMTTTATTKGSSTLTEWFNLWIPSLVDALIQNEPIRRKQVAAFCLPRIEKIVSIDDKSVLNRLVIGTTNHNGTITLIPTIQDLVIETYTQILQTIVVNHQQRNNNNYNDEIVTSYRETMVDRLLWAQLEVIRHAGIVGLFKQFDTNNSTSTAGKKIKAKKIKNDEQSSLLPQNMQLVLLLKTIATSIQQHEQLKEILVHSVPLVRVVAFQTLQYILLATNETQITNNNDNVDTYCMPSSSSSSTNNSTCFERMALEIELWKFALPYAVKTEGKEYILSILHCLLSFLDRLSIAEDDFTSYKRNMENNTNTNNNIVEGGIVLPQLHSFIVDFLIHDFFVRKLAYTGTVNLKEDFALALMEGIIVYVCRDHPLSVDSKLLPKASAIYTRRRQPSEEVTMKSIYQSLVHTKVYSSLLCMMYSQWDQTRAGGFEILIGLNVLASSKCVPLPKEFVDEKYTSLLESKGYSLASSPRQREADTGSKMIAFVCHSIATSAGKLSYFRRLASILKQRLSQMKVSLTEVMSEHGDVYQGNDLPLAHGIIHGMTLSIENDQALVTLIDADLIKSVVNLLCQAIKLSLTVVADLKESGLADDSNDDVALCSNDSKRSTAINPGAIGANGIFSSVTRTSDNEISRRLASQRIVVGSWLLTKETCFALSTILTLSSRPLDRVGLVQGSSLLLSTLTSLKHAGAAFAAHRALQRLCKACMISKGPDPEIRQLPDLWVDMMFEEVEQTERVRDSTLRRSTGYGLGFLAIMRSEISSRLANRPLTKRIMLSILRLSLPPQGSFDAFVDVIGLSKSDKQQILVCSAHASHVDIVPDDKYSVTSRVHALNILRMILLDAPSAQVVFPFVGVSFIASVMGYTDNSWNVRNSSTMVFAAAMLRSIDPDKNASNTDDTSSRAISIFELFKAYPMLEGFFTLILQGFATNQQHEREEDRSYLPPILPILILIGRVQPVSQSGHESLIIAEKFLPFLLKCIEHPYICVRSAAARAIRNISSLHLKSISSVQSILEQCQRLLLPSLQIDPGQTANWNLCHGLLLVISELVTNAKISTTIVRDSQLYTELKGMCSHSNLLSLLPAPCVAVALEVIDATSDSIDSNVIQSQCIELIVDQDQSNQNIPGTPDLANTLATRHVYSLTITLWHPSTSDSDYDTVLQQLSLLLNSNNFDMMIPSIKVFKKQIYDGIDTLAIHSNAIGRIHKLSKMLLNIIQFRLGDTIFHEPSKRRILKCLLEVLEARQRINQNDETYDEVDNECRKIALSLMNTSSFFMSQYNSDKVVISDGYILQILAISSRNSLNNCEVIFNTIITLSDPTLHWKLRYSAAAAFNSYNIFQRISQFLLLINSNNYATSFVDVLSSWITLIQDSDIDVRNTATRLLCGTGSNKYSQVPEISLRIAFDYLRHYIPYNILQCVAYNIIYNTTKHQVAENLRSVALYKRQQCTTILKDINTTPPRAIFEGEEPNSYCEPCLIPQVAIAFLIDNDQQKRDTTTVNNECCTTTLSYGEELVKLCTKFFTEIISTLHPTDSNDDDYILFLQDMIRGNGFPSFHNLLLASLCLIQNDALVNTVELRTMLISFSTRYTQTHPEIIQILEAIDNVLNKSHSLQLAIRPCLFLWN